MPLQTKKFRDTDRMGVTMTDGQGEAKRQTTTVALLAHFQTSPSFVA